MLVTTQGLGMCFCKQKQPELLFSFFFGILNLQNVKQKWSKPKSRIQRHIEFGVGISGGQGHDRVLKVVSLRIHQTYKTYFP